MEKRATLAGSFDSSHLGRRFSVYHEGNSITGSVYSVKHGTSSKAPVSQITLKSEIGLCFLDLSADHPLHELVEDAAADEPTLPELVDAPVIANPLKTCPVCGHAFHGIKECFNMASDNDCNCAGVVVTVT